MSLALTRIAPAIPVTDLDRARGFYGDVIGLEEIESDGREAILEGAGTQIILNLRDEPPKADNTAASFEVEDLAAAMDELKARGVSFLDVDLPGIKTVDGVFDDGECQTAWFSDTEGNILCVCSDLRAQGARSMAMARKA